MKPGRKDSKNRSGERLRRFRKEREDLGAGDAADFIETKDHDDLQRDSALSKEEAVYPFHVVKNRLRDCSWLQEQAISKEWLARYVLDLLNSDSDFAKEPSHFFKRGKPASNSGLLDRDTMARGIAMVATSLGTTKAVMRAQLNVDYDRQRIPSHMSEGIVGGKFDKSGLFGEKLAHSVHQTLDLWRSNPMRILDQFERIDPLEVLAAISVFQWSNKQREDYRDLDSWNDHGRALLALIMISRDYWIRPLKEWKPACLDVAQNFRSLLTHLFLVYPAPDCLLKKLNGDQWSNVNIHTFLWAIFIGRGVSLHRVARLFGWHVPKGFVAALFATDSDCSPFDSTCLRAEASRLGASKRTIRFIEIEFRDVVESFSYGLQNQASYVDLFQEDKDTDFSTAASTDASIREQFKSIVLWFVRNERNLQRGEGKAIAGWMRHLFSEAQRENRTLVLHGNRFSLANVRRELRLYQEAIRRPQNFPNPRSAVERRKEIPEPWPSLGFDREFVDEDGTPWKFTQLLTSASLREEGLRMQHCVGGYTNFCASGRSAIFRLLRNGLRVTTIEIRPSEMKVIQMMAKSNQRPSDDALQAATRWYSDITGGKVLELASR